MNRTWLAIILALTFIAILLTGHIGSSRSVMEVGKLKEVPERYRGEPLLLLKDFQDRRIGSDEAIQVLILLSLDKPGIFLPMVETDTRMDYYYIDKARHEAVADMKRNLYQYKK